MKASAATDVQRTRAVSRAMTLLAEIVEAEDGARLADLARATSLSASTALRLLRALEGSDFVGHAADGRYRVGTRLLQIGLRAVGSARWIEQVRPYLQSLTAATGESSYLGVPGPKKSVLYVANVESPQAVRHVSWPGRLIPMDSTAIGAAMQGRVNGHGYAISDKTLDDQAIAIAAPLHDEGGEIVAAISVVGPKFRMTRDKANAAGELLVAAAAEVSRLSSMR